MRPGIAYVDLGYLADRSSEGVVGLSTLPPREGGPLHAKGGLALATAVVTGGVLLADDALPAVLAASVTASRRGAN